MEVVRFNEMEEFNTPEGVMKPLFVSEKIAVIHLKIPAGLKVEPHSHPRDGIMILTKGRVRLASEREKAEINTGDLAFIPANFVTGLECEDDAEAILISLGAHYKTLDELKSILRRLNDANE
ncbi:cupin domain-containing protein [Archaeoglobus sp.]